MSEEFHGTLTEFQGTPPTVPGDGSLRGMTTLCYYLQLYTLVMPTALYTFHADNNLSQVYLAA